MRFIEDLVPLRLYPASKKLFAPINLKNKQRGAAIMLLAPNSQIAEELTELPYIYNPNYFKSYYISRDITAYIDHNKVDITTDDDNDEEPITESYYYDKDKGSYELIYDSSVSLTTKRKIHTYLMKNHWFEWMAGELKIRNLDTITFTVYEHESFKDLQKYIGVSSKIHGYATEDTIHIVSENAYNDEDGTYEEYIKHEFVAMLLHNTRRDINPAICAFVSGYYSNQYKNTKLIKKTSGVSGSIVVADLIKKKGLGPVRKMIRDNDISIIINYAGRKSMRDIMALFEAKISTAERNELKDSDFGIPSLRKYPLNDEAHVRAAIKMFNHVDSANEEELAKRIKSKIKQFGIKDISVGKTNRFSKYYSESTILKEELDFSRSADMNKSYREALKVFNRLSREEQSMTCPKGYKRTLNTVYLHVAHDEKNKPIGFIQGDLYPSSNKDIIHVTIAVDKDYRGEGVGDNLIIAMKVHCEMNYPNKTLLWKCDVNNTYSYELAKRHGFNLSKDKYDYIGYYHLSDTAFLDFHGIHEAIENTSDKDKSTVYFTRSITPDSLCKIYTMVAGNIAPDRAMVKINSGEPGGHNYLKPELIGKLTQLANGVVCDTNTAYEGKRNNTESHLKVMDDHGFTSIGDVDILDSEGEITLPVEDGLELTDAVAGSHIANYDQYIILSHFKGHAMAGFGGAMKNVAIGLASARGKSLIHTGGKEETGFGEDEPKEIFLKSLADATKAFTTYMGDRAVYINIANNISVDCDCDAHSAPPNMKDIGIFASTDPLAVDQACIDFLYAADDSKDVQERIESRQGLTTLDYAEQLGIGNRKYDIVDMDDDSEVSESAIFEADLPNRYPISLSDKRQLAKERNIPIFVCLFHFSSALSTVIAAVTKDEYTHSAISFDTSMTDMYSFGKFYPNNPFIGKFVKESLFGPTYNQVTRHAVYTVFVTPVEKEIIKKKLDWFIANKEKMRYNYEGLVKALLHIPDKDVDTKYSYLCSEFVASILKSTGRDFIQTPNNLIKPNDFKNYNWCYYLGSGEGRAYDRSVVDRRLKEIIRERNNGNPSYLESAAKTENRVFHTLPTMYAEEVKNHGYASTDTFLMTYTEGSGFVTFFDEIGISGGPDKKYDSKIRRYIYKERLKNTRSVMRMYDRIRAERPRIKRMYPKLGMYKSYNLFVDVSYYHELFLRNNTFKMDRAVNMYWDFVNRLINSKEIDNTYEKKTIFIPIDRDIWGTSNVEELVNYRKSLNPISMIWRLMRTNPGILKQEWGNKTFLFVSPRGYFTIDFSKLELKGLGRLKNHIRKLLNYNEPIVDDEDPEDANEPDTDSPTVIALKVSEKIEDKYGVEIPVDSTRIDKSVSTKNNVPIDTNNDLVLYRDEKFKLPEEGNKYIAIAGVDTEDCIAAINKAISRPRDIKTYIKLDQ